MRHSSLSPLYSLCSVLGVLLYSLPFNPLNTPLNPIHHLLALLGARHILHVSRIRVNMPHVSMLASGTQDCGFEAVGFFGLKSTACPPSEGK
jgi:hypothetical protein